MKWQADDERHHEKGQGMVEYSLIFALVAIIVITVLVALGPAVASFFK